MKLKLLEKSKDGNKIALRVTGASGAYLNTLRRLLMNEVPIMAIEDVEFRKNNSILYDEMVSHRLGMIPLTTDIKSYKLPSEAKDPEGPDAQLKLTLKSSAEKEAKFVYSKDIKSKDPKVKPVFPDIPIARLLPGQEIQCEMTACMGIGKDHSKWSGCLAWFKHFPAVKITKQPANAKDLAERYPQVFQIKQGKLVLDEEGLTKHDIIDEDITKESGGAISYEVGDDYVFFIETWGQLDAKTMLEQAISIHNDQLKEFKKLLKA